MGRSLSRPCLLLTDTIDPIRKARIRNPDAGLLFALAKSQLDFRAPIHHMRLSFHLPAAA
ncbi:hypothetical protein REJC140_00564 [Pseudorhizobium endolithicum]|uniref:Transposase n=1 Tax=Pseudorhizobium endolithicum TaxID=1191678 RepID=A0ABN7JDR8_9HYPH|nr:hypothetical protein REJC140_00564 [Pseudorhizobium endolithicum]